MSAAMAANPQHAYFSAVTKLSREWLGKLNLGETRVLLFLMSHTLGRGRRQGHYNEEQILNGISGYGCGTELGRTTLYRAMKSLETMGLITRKACRGGWNFIVNPEWSAEEPMLKTPKNHKPRTETELEEYQNGTYPKIDISEDRHPHLTSFDTEPVEPEEARTTGPRPFVRPKPSETPVNPEIVPQISRNRDASTSTVFENVWRTAWAETYPAHVTPDRWTKIEMAQMKRLAAAWPKESGEFTDFVDFVVRNWTTICGSAFKWMTKEPPPEFPKVLFLCANKLFKGFKDAWVLREHDRWKGTLDGTERSILNYMSKGMTREAASHRVAQEQALQIDRKQREAELQEAARQLETAKLMVHRAERMHRFSKATKVEQEPIKAPARDRDPDAPIVDENFQMPDFSKWNDE